MIRGLKQGEKKFVEVQLTHHCQNGDNILFASGSFEIEIDFEEEDLIKPQQNQIRFDMKFPECNKHLFPGFDFDQLSTSKIGQFRMSNILKK